MKKSGYNKKLIANVMLEEIEKDKPAKIETELFKNFKIPEKIVLKEKNTGYTPDIKVVLDDGKINLYEIELEEKYDIEKWKLYSVYAKRSKGDLYIILPDWMLDQVKNTLVQNEIKNVNLIYFPDKNQGSA